MRLDIHADIIPGESLGGITLRVPLLELREVIEDYRMPRCVFQLVSLYEARYLVANGAIELGVDVRNGKVFKLCAMDGYRGQLFGKLRVGMSVQEAMSIEPRLYYDECEEMLLMNGVEGVSLDVPEIDPEPSEVPSMSISAICVHIPELYTTLVTQGLW